MAAPPGKGNGEAGPSRDHAKGGSSSSALFSSAQAAALPPAATTAASALAIPSPSHLNIASSTASGGLSPIARHTRGAFDSTPSFSSPLAYASTLPTEQADDLELDAQVITEDDETSSRKSDSTVNSIPSAAASTKPRKTSSSSYKHYSPQTAETYDSTDEERQQSLLDTPTPTDAASVRRERSTSARARLLAWDKQDAASQSPKSGSLSTLQPFQTPAGHSRRKSQAPTTLMGPPLTIPRKASAGVSSISSSDSSSRLEADGFSRISSSRIPSGMSDDSQRSVSNSSIASAEGSMSSSTSWQAPYVVSNLAPRASQAVPIADKAGATPSRRVRANTSASISSAHRRAKSMGGSMLGESASPIGGPDGVDPDLVAAIRAGDSSIPGPVSGLESSISRLSIGGDAWQDSQSVSPTSRIASLPSTPHGSVRISSSRVSGEHLGTGVDTKAASGAYPNLRIPRREQGDGNGFSQVSPTDVSGSAGPPDHSRTRARSQTLSPPTTDSAALPPPNTGELSVSFNPSMSVGTSSRANAPLGDAIRLQKMPSNIRSAGEFYSRSDSNSRLLPPSSSQGGANASVPSAVSHGLGIGMSTNPDSRLPVPPQTPSVSRSASPLMTSDLTRSSSISSTSGRNSPVLPVRRREQTLGPATDLRSGGEPSPLTVDIPLFSSQTARLESLSALPALSYRSGAPASPLIGRGAGNMGPPSSTQLSMSLSASQSAFAPLLAMPSPQFERPRGPRGSLFSDASEIEYSYDPASRPAPWIASSQEVRRGSSSTTLKAALTQRSRASMSTTMGSGAFEVQSAAARTNSTRSKENRRISVAPAPQGIDDYARIIVQSRNAKMQKWRTMGKQQSPYNSVQQSTLGDMRGSLRESSSRVLLQPWDPSGVPLDRTASADYLPSEIATPNVSPAGSQSALQEEEDLHQLTETAGRREIEWVDWLDEYRKMKEAKLRSEKEEIETQRREEEEAEVSLELEVLPISQSATPTTATSHDFPAMPTMSRSTEPSMASLSQSLSSSMGIPDSKRGSRPRRPSEMPRFTARQDSSIRRSSSNAYFSSGSKDSGSYEGSTSPVDRRASIFGDKNRTLSLSPINSRLGNSSSQLGGFGANAAAASSSSKRKKMLGGKIEAWWGAVKSGFGGTPSSLMGISSMQPPVPSPHLGFSSYSSKSIPSNRTKESRQPREAPAPSNDLYSIFGSQSYGLPHNRSNTLQVPAHDSAETQSVHMLRAASSVQNMRSGEGEGDEMASSEGLADSVSEEASKRSNRSSTGTAHAVPHLTPAPNVEEGLTGSPDDEKDRSVGEESATQKRSTSKGSHLSLHLRHGQSAFDAAPFEKLSSSQSGVSSAPAADETATTAPADEVPETTLSSAPAATPFTREAKTLSDAWKPEIGEESKPQMRSSHRGRSSQRHGQADNAEARSSSKDFTINSIRQHIHNRLTSSKEAFDRELKKIIHSINAYVEEALQEQLLDEGPERESEQSGEPEEEGTIETMPDRDTSLEASLGLLTLGESMPTVATPGDISGDSLDADRTAQPESEGHTEAPTPRPSRDTEESTGPKSSTAQQDYTLPSPPHARKPSMAALLPGRSVSRSTTLSRQSRHGDTLSTSRSTSRSHSPMPGATLHGVQATESPQYSPARRLRQLDAEEAPVEPFVTALQDLVAIAMDVYDTSIYTLTSTSGACSDIISQVQAVGRRWDENPQWDGRGWYVQLLLAVAGLSRVVEWWEAEKGFWNFQDETEQGNKGDAEPIRFIVGNLAAAADGQEYGDYSLSSARSAVSTSPSRIRQLNPQQILSLTPSQHSSAHSSPALEPWDRRVVSEGDRGRMSLGKATMDAAEDGSSKAEEASATSAPVERSSDKRESQNVVMELSLVGERFLYVSPAWTKVIGSDPGDVLDLPIEEVLAPGDASTFAQATQQLQANDAHTVEVAFRLQVRSAHLEEAGTTYYQEMEGKGMLMHDRQSAMPSHTMWVFKPVGSPEAETDLAPGPQKPAAGAGEPPVVTEAAGGSAATQILISTEPLLCRICERDVPTWFFEKHSEICNEIHRLEMEISENNEGLAELRRTARTIVQAIDDVERTEGIEYRNLLLSTPAATTGPPSALEVANRSITPRHLNPAAIRKTHLRALDSILAILRTAANISTPAVKDDTASDPIEKQRLLSPDSEDRIVQVKNWKKVSCEDAALDMLATDVETAMRSKLSAVNRMLNTIVYVETVRMEWEGRVEAALGQVREESDSDESAGSAIEEQEADSSKSQHVRDDQAMSEEMDDVEERGAAAVLLDTYEPDATRSTSTSLSARRDLPGGAREEDIPGVENELGGSVMENISPIPIPASQRNSSARVPHRQMIRDPSSTSSFGVDSIHSPPLSSHAGLRLDTNPTVARSINREALLNSDVRRQSSTPPLSPRHSPAAELAVMRPKDRRISVTQRNGLHSPHLSGMTPLSPRIPPAAPSSRPTASSIKDFDIIKPISKGAFGSVFLAKKRTTGDYYAIKVLKKSDMIAKNQITNVKAERMILMTQTQSPFVVKLFFTFQSAEYLYLVMEYLPGGDCASLCKALGGLPEDWTKQYIAEVVNGLEMLHSKGVVHRDMKPDNLLIDQKGHLKLTDFGLSKIGLLGRQNRQQLAVTTKSAATQPAAESGGGHSKKSSISSSTASSPAGHVIIPAQSPPSSRSRIPETPLSLSIAQSQNFFVGVPPAARGRILSASTDASDSSGSDSPMALGGAKQVPVMPASVLLDSPSHIFGPHMMAESQSNSAGIHSSSGSGGTQTKKFVGTPDYLAPESILGLGMDDAAVDWWALGVILYEFLYGFPPFHADTPEKVFDNILSRNIEWDEEDGDANQISAQARDLMEKLMCTDRKHRLGAGENGAADIKAHPFFEGIDWDNLTKVEGPFVPQITDAESTDYFDLRGAVYQEFSQEEQGPEASKQRVHSTGFHREFAKALEGKRSIEPSRPPSRYRMRLDRNKTQDGSSGAADDFGSFSFKNLPMLKQANDEVVKKMRGDQLNSMSSAMMDQSTHNRHRSLSGKVTTPGQHRASAIFLSGNGPPSPSTSVSSQSSVPSKSTAPTSPSGAPLMGSGAHHLPSLHHHLAGQSHHRRRPSELSSAGGGSSVAAGSPTSATVAILMERKRSLLNDADSVRRTSMPTRLRTDSTGVLSDKMSASPGTSSQVAQSTASTSTSSPSHRSSSAALDAGSKAREEGQAERQGAAPGANEEIATSPTTMSGQLSCLVAEDNPISLKMLEHVLCKLGCNVTSVRNGAEALRLAMGDTKFAVLFIDASLPIVNGQDVARMIKSTRNTNSSTPIVGLTSDDAATLVDMTGNVFDAALVKPVERSDVCNVLPQLGFKPMLATTASASASRSASGSGPSQDVRS